MCSCAGWNHDKRNHAVHKRGWWCGDADGIKAPRTQCICTCTPAKGNQEGIGVGSSSKQQCVLLKILLIRAFLSNILQACFTTSRSKLWDTLNTKQQTKTTKTKSTKKYHQQHGQGMGNEKIFGWKITKHHKTCNVLNSEGERDFGWKITYYGSQPSLGFLP